MNGLVAVEIEEREEVVVARVSGELDIAGAAKTGDALAEAVPTSARGLVLDFSQLEFIDSSGIAMLFALARRLSGRRQELRLVSAAGSPVKRVLDIVDFGRAAPIDEDLDGALAALA